MICSPINGLKPYKSSVKHYIILAKSVNIFYVNNQQTKVMVWFLFLCDSY